LSGIKATQRVRRELPAVGVVILTAQDQEQTLFEAIRAGAAPYLHKDCEPTELIDAIRKVRAGQFIINEKIFSRPAVASKVLAEFRELSVYGPGSTHVFAPLSPREVQILDNIAQGMTNKEVAYALAISEQTVKNHMSSILRKLSVNDRTQAADAKREESFGASDEYTVALGRRMTMEGQLATLQGKRKLLDRSAQLLAMAARQLEEYSVPPLPADASPVIDEGKLLQAVVDTQ